MVRLIGLLLWALVLSSTIPARAADMPTKFLGGWTTGNDGALVDGINISARSYREPGFNCDIKSINVKNDAGNSRDRDYIVDMVCAGDRPNPDAQRVHEIWALRNINGKDVLIVAGTSGSTYPSIGVLQRCRDRADSSGCNM